MPSCQVVFHRDARGEAPVLRWLERLRSRETSAFAKCAARLRRLAAIGHQLRRPEADYVRKGIYELRARHGKVNYRVLYFLHGRGTAVLVHGLSKEGQIPRSDLRRSLRRKAAYEADPERHTYEEGGSDG